MRSHHPNQKIRERAAGLVEDGHFNGRIRENWDRLELPLHVRKPQIWTAWSDLFHAFVGLYFQYEAFEMMMNCPQHTFIVCTKRANRMKEVMHSIWFQLSRNYPNIKLPLPNVIGMVTAENQEMADERIPLLLDTKFAMRGVSVEPMLEPIDIEKYLLSCGDCGNRGSTAYVNYNNNLCQRACIKGGEGSALDWVICGCESGTNRRHCDIDWVRSLRDQCVAAGVPFLLKQLEINGKLSHMPELDGKVWDEFPRGIRL
jgi:protein gp37